VLWLSGCSKEGIRIGWYGRASNPVGGVSRSRVGSTPAAFRQFFVSLSRGGYFSFQLFAVATISGALNPLIAAMKNP
jgi:hypothetical protein